MNELGGSSDILGKPLKFAEGSLAVIGVMPRGFRSPGPSADIWMPVHRFAELSFPGIARLKPGVTPQEAEQRINVLVEQIEREYPSAAVSRHVQIQEIRPVPKETRRLLTLLFASVGCILLIAIINITNLLLSRGVGREREMAIRTALGAGRPRLVRQLLTESVWLAGLGGGLGFLGASGLTNIILSQLPPDFPRATSIYMDSPVLAFVLVTTLLTAVLFGSLPALGLSKPDVQSSLKEGIRQSSESGRMRRVRQGLVSAEVGLATMLLIGAAFAGMSFWNAVSVPLGMETRNVVVANIQFSAGRYNAEAARTAFRDDLIARIRGYGDVESASLSSGMPIGIDGLRYAFGSFEGVTIDPQARPEDKTPPIDLQVTSDYFKTLRIPLVQGRAFRDGERAIVINETLARRYWRNSSPIGTRFRFSNNPAALWYTIAGIAKDQNAPFFLGFMYSRYPEIFHP